MLLGASGGLYSRSKLEYGKTISTVGPAFFESAIVKVMLGLVAISILCCLSDTT